MKRVTEKYYVEIWNYTGKVPLRIDGPFKTRSEAENRVTILEQQAKEQGYAAVYFEIVTKNPTRTGRMPSDFRLRIMRGADGVGGQEKFWIWDSAFRTVRGGPYDTGREARDAFRILKSKGRHSRKVAYGKVKAKKKRSANPGLVKIYAKVTRIEAQKGNTGKFPGEKFFHNFKPPYPAMYGTSDRKRLIIKRG